MLIKKYGEFAAIYAPDVGEVVHARRSIAHNYTRAVVLRVRRVGDGVLEVRVQWLADDPATGSSRTKPVMAGDTDLLTTRVDGYPPALIRQITGGGQLSG